MFQSVYDYPYLSSSANHIFDMTLGYSSTSGISGSAGTHVQRSDKIDIYNEMAQVMAGYSSAGNINTFDHSGSFGSNTTTTMKDILVFNFARLLTKDQIQIAASGFQMSLGVGAAYINPFADNILVQDNNSTNSFSNSPAGRYNTLFATNAGVVSNEACGLVFYDAGVAILTSSIFNSRFNGATDCVMLDAATPLDMNEMLVSGSVSGTCDAIRRRVQNISFNNTTELNSTIYFCRSSFNEFNYSSNPTYITGSKLRVKSVATDDPVSYITTVGLYSPDNELLAVGKVSV